VTYKIEMQTLYSASVDTPITKKDLGSPLRVRFFDSSAIKEASYEQEEEPNANDSGR
jgi:hypothetical protein